MTNHDTKIREVHTSKLVSNARAILSNHIGLPLGVHKMVKRIYWIDQIKPLLINLASVKEYYEQIKEYPLGSDRLLWNPIKLLELDAEIEEITHHYRRDLLLKCFEIIHSFSSKEDIDNLIN